MNGRALRVVGGKDREERPERLLPESAGRVPPHNLDAEGAVLSAILLSREALDRVLEILKPEHFYSDANGRIYEAAQTLALAGTPVDIVTVADFLRDKGRIQQIGGPAYLGELADLTPAIHHVVAHAKVVFGKWRHRALIATCQRIAAEGYGDVPDDFIDQAAKEIHGLNELVITEEGAFVDEAVGRAEAKLRNPKPDATEENVKTGFARLDRMTGGMRNRDLILLGAPTGTGKSTLSRAILANICNDPLPGSEGKIKQGAAVISLEMTEDEIVMAMACTEARVDSLRLDAGELTPPELVRLEKSLHWIRGLPLIIYGRRTIRVGQIPRLIDNARGRLKARGAVLRFVVIDTHQILAMNEPRDPKRTDESISDDVARRVGDLAEKQDVPVMLITQLTFDKDKGVWKARGSGAIEMHAKSFWILEVHEKKPATGMPSGKSTTPLEASIKLKKQRKGGKNQFVPMWFTPAFTLFAESLYDSGDE